MLCVLSKLLFVLVERQHQPSCAQDASIFIYPKNDLHHHRFVRSAFIFCYHFYPFPFPLFSLQPYLRLFQLHLMLFFTFFLYNGVHIEYTGFFGFLSLLHPMIFSAFVNSFLVLLFKPGIVCLLFFFHSLQRSLCHIYYASVV